MKIMVMGHGAVGTVLCDLFAREKSVKSIICVEKEIRHFRNKGKLHFKQIDLSSKKQISTLIKKENPDLIINSSLPIFNKPLLQACLENNINYMDLASYWDFDKNPRAKSPYKVEQLDFDSKFKKKGIVGLINTGASPGMTNLLTKECVDFFDKIDSIKIRLYEDTKIKGLYFPWSVEWLLDEINWKPLVYRNGKFRIMENFAEEETYVFPEHLGKRKTYLVGQEEVGTIPLFIKLRNVDIKMFDSQATIAKFLMELGLVSEETIRAGGHSISPVEFITSLIKSKQEDFLKMQVPGDAQFAFVVEALGTRRGKRKKSGFYVIFPRQREINRLGLHANFISYPTAIAAKTFAMELQNIKNPGVYPPENLEKAVRHRIITELKKHVKIRKFEK